MATKKTTTRKRAPAKRMTEADVRARRQVHAIILFAVGMFVGAVSIITGDSLWKSLHNLLYGLCGAAAVFIAPLLIYTAIMTTLDKPIGTVGSKVWQTAALIVLISAAVQVFSYGPLLETGLWDSIVALYDGGVSLDGGGLISALVGLPLMALCGRTGAKVAVVLLLFVFAMIFSGATLIGLYRGAVKPVRKMGETYAQRVSERAQAPAAPAAPKPRRPRGKQPPEETAALPAAAPPVPGGRFNVDVPLDPEAPPPDGREELPAAEAGGAPRGSFARKAIEVPVDAARDALFSAARPAGKFEFDYTPVPPGPVRSDGLPLEPEETAPPETVPEPGALGEFGAGTVLHFRQAPAQPQARPQTTDEVIDEILRRALGETGDAAQEPQPDDPDGDLPEEPPAPWDGALPSNTIAGPWGDEPAAAPGEELPARDEPLDALERKLMTGIEELEAESAAPGAGVSAAPAPPAFAPPPAAVDLPPEPQPYVYPPVTLLSEVRRRTGEENTEELKANAQRLVDTLQSFGVQTRVIDIARGPAVTRYELQPSAGVKISKITSLADDIALNLAAAGVRIEAPIPNKPAVGIEVPNKVVSMVQIREIIDSDEFREAKSPLTVALGRDISGRVTVADAAKMPHMLIAGATGSGKSVCINSIIVSLLFKSPPDKVKLLMVDPKVVELGIYNGIPHLLVPVVTDPKKAAGALAWAVSEMLGRYKQFADNSVRDIAGFNRLCPSHPELVPMPHVVIIIDELADLMMAAPNDVEDYICRLAQMARAAGMHLIIATQRPSVDVITGVIKANIPSRIAFAVSSSVDSRTILDSGGAEKLLGRGDMLFYPVGAPKPQRVQGCFVSDQEVEAVVEFIKRGAQQNEYDEGIMEEIERQAAVDGKKKGSSSSAQDDGGGFDEEDDMLPAAIECVIEMGMASTSMLQRKLKLGYARAARIVDQLEEKGIVGPFEGSKPRQVLITRDQWYEMKMNNEE